jgi:hypothetical protein
MLLPTPEHEKNQAYCMLLACNREGNKKTFRRLRAESSRARNVFFNPSLLHVASVQQGGQEKNISSAEMPIDL